MAMGFSVSLRTARATALITAMDAAAPTPGYIEFYSGSRPGTGAAITAQVLLGTVTLGAPSGTVASGTLTLTTATDDLSVDADGTLTWCRVYDGAGTFVADFNCGLNGSGATVIFNTVVALQGGILKINSGIFTEGNA